MPSPPNAPPPSTRQRILDEATSQVLASGYSAFTIAAVRDALGLSSGSMFHAFPSKPALVAAVFVEGMQRYQDAAIAALSSDVDPEVALHRWIATHLRWVEDHRALAGFLFSTQPAEVVEAAASSLADANASFDKSVGDLFLSLERAGASSELNHAVAHALVMGPVQEYCRQWIRGRANERPTAMTAILQRSASASLRSTREERP